MLERRSGNSPYIPQRYDAQIKTIGDPTLEKLVAPRVLQVLGTPRLRPKLEQISSITRSIFAGSGVYQNDLFYDLASESLTRKGEERSNLLGGAYIVFDLNDFRSFDLANKDIANKLTDDVCHIVCEQCEKTDKDEYYSIVVRVFGDEFYILRIPKTRKTFVEMKNDHGSLMIQIGEEIAKLKGLKKVSDGTSTGKEVMSSLSGKAKGAFVCEAISAINPSEYSTDDLVSKIAIDIRAGLTDYKDIESDGRKKDRTVDIDIKAGAENNFFGTTTEGKLEERARQANDVLDKLPELKQRTLAESYDFVEDGSFHLRPEYYPEWVKNMLHLLVKKSNRPIEEIFAIPFLQLLSKISLLDPFSEVAGFPIFNHEAFLHFFIQQIAELKGDEDVAVMAIDPALIKEMNANISWHDADEKLKIILQTAGDLRKGDKSSQIEPYLISKDGGRFFITFRGKKDQCRKQAEYLVDLVNKVCADNEIPLRGDKGLLSLRTDILEEIDKLYPENKENQPVSTTLSSGNAVTYLRDVINEDNLQKKLLLATNQPTLLFDIVGELMDRARMLADWNKNTHFVFRALQPLKFQEVFLVYDRRGPGQRGNSRYPERARIANEIIDVYDLLPQEDDRVIFDRILETKGSPTPRG